MEEKNIFRKIHKGGDAIFLVIFALCFGGVAAALVSQHVYDMQPCAWCILQRLIFICLGLLSLLCYFTSFLKKINLYLIMMICTYGMAIAAYQQFVASKSNDCSVSLAEKIIHASKLNEFLPEVFGIYAMCAEANIPVMGIPYAILSLGLFCLIDMVATLSLTKAIKNGD